MLMLKKPNWPENKAKSLLSQKYKDLIPGTPCGLCQQNKGSTNQP